MWCANIGNNTNRGRCQGYSWKQTKEPIHIVKKGLNKRYRSEKRFKIYGLSSILISMVFQGLLFISIIGTGYSAFFRTVIRLDITFGPESVSKETLSTADYSGLVKKSLRESFPDVEGRREKRQLYGLVSSGAAFQIRRLAMADPSVIGKTLSVWVPANDDVDMLMKGEMWSGMSLNRSEGSRTNNWPGLTHYQVRTASKRGLNTAFFYRLAIPGNRSWQVSGGRSWDPFTHSW